LGLYPAEIGGTVVQVLVTVFSPEMRSGATKLAAQLRAEGINTELILQDKKLGQQFGTADKKGIPLVAVQGPDEAAQGVIKLKRLRVGVEVSVPSAEAGAKSRELLG